MFVPVIYCKDITLTVEGGIALHWIWVCRTSTSNGDASVFIVVTIVQNRLVVGC